MRAKSSALVLFLSSFTFAQTPVGSVVGRITDPAGGFIPGAQIQIVNLDTTQAREAIASEEGSYTVPNLLPGRYSLEVRAEGFRLHRRPEFGLLVDQVLRLDVRLEVGAVSEAITVTDIAPVLNTENGTRGDVTTNEELTEMPLAGRNFGDLAYLTGGVIPKAEDTDGTGYAINGARADNTGFLLDGVNNTQRRNTGSMVSPPLEGVQEFKMLTSGFSAEYGRYAGGVLSVVLKSGGNRVRGTLYHFLRNDMFDARNFFDLTQSKLRRNQFGATLSGPVKIPGLYNGKNKTFFLFSWESLRQVAGSTRRAVTPLPEMLTGNFRGALDANNRPLTLTDPYARAPFPGNQVPVTRMDPVARKMAAFYPKPNLTEGVNNFVAQANATSVWDNFTAKVDHNFSPRNQLSGRVLWRPSDSFDPFTRSFIPDFGSTTRQFEILTALRFTRTFTPTLIGEWNASFSRKKYNWGWPDNTRDWSGEVGFQGGTTNPIALGLPQIEATGYVILGHAYDLPKLWSYNNYQYSGVITWIRGTHNVKFGADFLRYQYFSRQYGDTRGRMTFLGRYTNEPMADFLLGYGQTSRRQLDAAGPYHLVSNYSAFIQDDWKVTPRLTINLGLRYDLMKPPQEKFGAWSSFVPELGKIAISGRGTIPDFDERIRTSGAAAFVTMAADAGLPATLIRPDNNDFSPRLGFAWRPFGGTRSVLRGGVGIFYGSSSLYRLDENSDTYPFSINESYSAQTSNPLLITPSNPFPESRRRVGGVTSTTGMDVNMRSQYLSSWNLTMEHDLGKGTALEIAYAGSKGTNLPRRYDINQPFRDPALRQADGSFPRPYPQFQTINYIIQGSNSIYNSGSATFRRRFSKDLFIRASYVFSKSIDESSNTGGTTNGGFPAAQDSRNLALERGRSDFDVGHSFVAAFIWQTNFTRNRLFRAWQFAGTTRAYSGQPFTAKVANVSLDLGEAVRPDRIAKGTLANPTPDEWFDRAAFPTVARGSYRFGNSGRNILDGPGSFLQDIGLSRRFQIAERRSLQFRWEVFNVPNRANFNLPLTSVDVRNGAAITRAKGARIHQLGLRLEF